MKIGIFSECYTPVMNGVVVSVQTFKRGLEERGHEVFIFAPEHKDAVAEHHVYRFPAITDKKGRLYPVLFPSVSVEKSYLPEEIVKELDVIHAQHMFTAGRLARYAAKKYDKPLIYTYHTMIALYTHYAGFLSPIVRLYLKNMSKRFCNTCDQLVTPSTPMKEILVKDYGISTPIEVITTGIDPKNYKHRDNNLLKEKYGIDKQSMILLYLSRIAKEKNIDLLFKSMIVILKEFPKCHLILAGGGPEENWAKERIKDLGLSGKVTMTGMLPKEEANKLFGMADIFTFPSYTETQGIVITEAMASGTPPVAVNKMGPVDLIRNGEDGFLTKLTVKDFSEKILILLKNEELRRKFANNGLERIDEFSTDTSVDKMVNLYQRVIKAYVGKTKEN